MVGFSISLPFLQWTSLLIGTTPQTGDSAPTDLNIPVFDRQKLPVKLEAFKK
jgi:hypothetical protein